MIWISNRYDIDHAYLSTSVSSFDKDLIFSWNNTPVRLPHFYNNNTTFKSFFWVREKMFILTFSFEKHNKILRLTFSFMHKISYICMHISLCCFSPKNLYSTFWIHEDVFRCRDTILKWRLMIYFQFSFEVHHSSNAYQMHPQAHK